MKRYGADRDKEIQRLLQEMPEEGFRLLFDVYHMQLCVYVVQLTDSFQLAEDIVQDFFVAFWERKYYRAITGNFRSYLYTSVHNAALAVLKKKKLCLLYTSQNHQGKEYWPLPTILCLQEWVLSSRNNR